MSSLSISITEQPTEFHRFRYETEVAGGKLGGLLYGRSSNKSCVRLRITGIDPLVHKTLIVVGGTVNPDLIPHPFFMVGDDCSSGAFQFKKDVASLGDKREVEISLEKVSLVCVSTKGTKLAESIDKRKRINFNPFSKDMDQARYNARNLKSVRLVFQVYYVSNFNEETMPTDAVAVSDIITDAKQQVKLGIFDIHPSTASVVGLQDVWIYFDEPLPHTDTSQFTVVLQSENFEHEPCPCTVKTARKHLLIVTKPDVSRHFEGSNERIKCNLVVKESKTGVTDSREMILSNLGADALTNFQAFFVASDDPPVKRKRALPADGVVEVNFDDLLGVISK